MEVLKALIFLGPFWHLVSDTFIDILREDLEFV